MSQDLGNVPAGFQDNFAYGTLALANNTYVQFVDKAKNSAGSTGPEALYVNALVVPVGCTLDLNKLHVYARLIQVAGTIVGGTVSQIPAAGQLSFDTPAEGVITRPSQVDDWTFYGRSGQMVAVLVNTGSQSSIPPVPPTLNYAQVQILDPSGHVVASGSNTQSGADILLQGVTLPTDGTYTVQVQVPANQSTSHRRLWSFRMECPGQQLCA